MDTQNYKDLSFRALALYRTITAMQKELNSMFWEEFLEIEKEEQKRNCIEKTMPF